MTNRYRNELCGLDQVYAATRQMNVGALSAAVETWLSSPMMMVGSGGSFSTATFASRLHERASGNLARAVTPLEILSGALPKAGIACFSASGRNRDIVAAFRAAARQEVHPLSALVLSDKSPLHEVAREFRYTHLVALSHPTFEDGFLAVATLLASSLALTRAYRSVLGQRDTDIPKTLDALIETSTSFSSVAEISPAFDAIAKRAFVSVLFTQALSAAAIDLESRFVEAALGPLHIADLRNFGHGRHVWLAKKATETGVLALIGDEQGTLGAKTLDLLPKSTEIMAVRFTGSADLQALAGLVVGFFVAESAGRHAGVDPGRPGVPSFGRALYRLAPQSHGNTDQTTLNRAAALRRKGQPENGTWIEHYLQALKRINSARFGGLVMDYDGTLCDTRDRFDPLPQPIVSELKRLCSSGAHLGIATGRGPSAGVELRKALPEACHANILVGYYNCAEIHPLADDTDPLIENLDRKHPIFKAIVEDPFFSGIEIRANAAQISIPVNLESSINEGIMRAILVLHRLSVPASVVASSHSIDVLLRGQSKRDLIASLAKKFELQGPFLRLGDRGRWPGNDAELLDDPFGLSVDEVSQHAEHGWGLAPAGVKGVQATLFYLRRLTWTRRGGRLKLTPGART